MKYTNPSTSYEGVVACADIGGTNFRLALVKVTAGQFSLIHKETHVTQEMKNPSEFLTKLIARWEQEFAVHIDGLGLALAGPVSNQVCRMTNANLELDGAAIASVVGRPVWLMNDLAGITWGVSLVDHSASPDLIHLGGPNASSANPQIIRKSVAAPGTGLGVGMMVEKQGQTIVLDSEAGHIDFAPNGPESCAFNDFIESRFKENPGYEQFVSGIGLENLFEFYCQQRPDAESPAITEIENCHDGSRGALISLHADNDPHCQAMMEQFVDMLGRFASAIALSSLPRSGLYLAGGIPGKNIPWLQKDHRFMKSFVKNYKDSISDLLKQIPVYVITDGDIGLFGAAWACIVENNL